MGRSQDRDDHRIHLESAMSSWPVCNAFARGQSAATDLARSRSTSVTAVTRAPDSTW